MSQGVPFTDMKARVAALRPEIDEALARVLESGWFILGPEGEAFERELAAALSAADAVAVGNGTEAIQLALEALGVGAGDEVVTSPLTAAFTALAILRAGARPVFADLDPATLNVTPDAVARAITKRTRALLPVHLYGHPCDLEPMLELARSRTASRWSRTPARRSARATRGARSGRISGLGALSFYPTKNLGAFGDGGAILVDDPERAARLRRLRNGGQSDRYRHEVVGVNSRLDEMQAALLRVGLRHLSDWTARRRALAALYLETLDGAGVGLPHEQPYAEADYHLFVIRHPRRDALMAAPQGARRRHAHPLPDPAAPAAGLRAPGGRAPATSRRPSGRRQRSCRCPSTPRCRTRRPGRWRRRCARAWPRSADPGSRLRAMRLWGHAVVGCTSFAAVVVASLALARRLRIEGTARIALAVGILAAGQIVLTVEGLSLLGRIRWAPLVIVHVSVAAALLYGVGPPTARTRRATAWRAPDAPLVLMGGMTLVAASVLALHAVLVPVSHDDSITYHLSKAVLYLQQGSLGGFDTADLRLTTHPANAEILILWQMAVSGLNAGGPLLQVLCWLGSAVAVSRLARDLGAGGRPAAFAGLAFASLPGLVLQATTAQNDLTMAFFTVSALTFARSGLAERRAGHLALAGVAYGLALGTKAVAILAAPALVLLVVAESVRARRVLRREGALLMVCCTAGLLLFGCYFYGQNLRRYGRLAGPAAFTDLGALPRVDARLAWSNLVRLGLRMSEPAGLVPPPSRPAAWIEVGHARFAAGVRAALAVEARHPQDYLHGSSPEHGGLPIEADVTAFGPLVALAGAPLLAFFAFRRRVDPAAKALAWGALAYLLGTAALLRYNFHLQRFLVGMVAIAAPLLAVLYREGGGRWVRMGNAALAAICCGTLGLCVAVRAGAPIARTVSAWQRGERAVPTRPERPEAETARLLFDRLPPGRVAFVPSVGDPVYPVFDRSLSRIIRMVRAGSAEGAATVGASDFVLIWGDRQRAIGAGELAPGAWPWFEIADLRPLVEQLQAKHSGWHPVLDGALYRPGSFRLFARRPLSPAEAARLPDLLPSSPPVASDRWRGPRFALPVRLDPARPVLRVLGLLGLITGGTVIYWFTGASMQAVTTGAYRAVEFIKANIRLDSGQTRASVEDSKRVVEIST